MVHILHITRHIQDTLHDTFKTHLTKQKRIIFFTNKKGFFHIFVEKRNINEAG